MARLKGAYIIKANNVIKNDKDEVVEVECTYDPKSKSGSGSPLMFFLGFRNALFVGFAIPMSMFMSLMIISALGYSLNTMILFALVMGLGMLVDNGIVVVENV